MNNKSGHTSPNLSQNIKSFHKYKTVACRHYLKGFCKYYNCCNFSHGFLDNVSKVKLNEKEVDTKLITHN